PHSPQLVIGVILFYYSFPDPVLRFFSPDPATPELSTLSLHDALPISIATWCCCARCPSWAWPASASAMPWAIRNGWASSTRCVRDRKSTRLNSSHVAISYAVFCLKKKKNHLAQHDALPAQDHPDGVKR